MEQNRVKEKLPNDDTHIQNGIAIVATAKRKGALHPSLQRMWRNDGYFDGSTGCKGSR